VYKFILQSSIKLIATWVYSDKNVKKFEVLFYFVFLVQKEIALFTVSHRKSLWKHHEVILLFIVLP